MSHEPPGTVIRRARDATSASNGSGRPANNREPERARRASACGRSDNAREYPTVGRCDAMHAVRRLALYAGGFLGPFGGGVLTVLIPDLREHFGVSTSVAALVLPAYLVPFAALQLVSGTIGGRLGVARTIRVAYVAYAAASLFAAATTAFGALLAARALQGAANAFTTPLLLATLAESVPAQTLGRTMGTFAAVQTAGIVSAPLLGGLAGDADFRLAFVIP